MLATYCFSGRLRTAIHPARRQLLFLCTIASHARSSACPRDSYARRPALHARDLAAGVRPCRATSSERPLGTSAPGTTHACLRATSQRALAPAERLHPGQPMLACAQPRSGRPPLPSVKQRAPSRNLCTRGNPCLQRVLLRDPCARLYIPCPQCVLLRDPCAWRLHAPRPRAVLQRTLAPAVRQAARAPPGCAKLSILCPQCVLLRDPCAQRSLAPVYDNSWPQRVIPLDPCVRLLYVSCPHARSAPRDPCQKQRAPFRDS
jgi:hypothetical protein